MVAMEVTHRLSWLSQLGKIAGQAVSFVKPDGGTPSEETSSLSTNAEEEEVPEWRSWEHADTMELGMAKYCALGYCAPAHPQDDLCRLLVERKRVGKFEEYALWSENAEVLLVARCEAQGEQVEIFVPSDRDDVAAATPAFTLNAGADRWVLTAERCECCEFSPLVQRTCMGGSCKQDLAHIYQSREVVGSGSAVIMEVHIPQISDAGNPAVWCRRKSQSTAVHKLPLDSLRPRWSQRLQTLTLDFHGRCRLSSSKNFMLRTRGSHGRKPADVDLAFGKVDKDSFALYYKHPLSLIQAFGIAITAKDWQ